MGWRPCMGLAASMGIHLVFNALSSYCCRQQRKSTAAKKRRAVKGSSGQQPLMTHEREGEVRPQKDALKDGAIGELLRELGLQRHEAMLVKNEVDMDTLRLA